MSVGKLYIGDDVFEVGEIQELELSPMPDESSPNYVMGIDLSETADFTCEVRLNHRVLLSIFTGRKITNNWLKMHGGIMVRKSWEERRRRKKK